MKSTAPLEHHEAVAFANYLRDMQSYGKVVLFAHLVNEFKLGSRFMPLLQSLKAEGWSKGVPDYFIVTTKSVLFIELKRQSGSVVSGEQTAWINALQSAKVPAYICKGADEAIKVVEQYI